MERPNGSIRQTHQLARQLTTEGYTGPLADFEGWDKRSLRHRPRPVGELPSRYNTMPVIGVPKDAVLPVIPNTSDTRDLYEYRRETRVELNALTGILHNKIVEVAVANAPRFHPFGLHRKGPEATGVADFSPIAPFISMSADFNRTLVYWTVELIHELQERHDGVEPKTNFITSDESHLDSVYSRYFDLMVGEASRNGDTPFGRLTSVGVAFASGVMGRTMELVARLNGSLDPEKLKKAYGFIASFAREHLDVQDVVYNVLRIDQHHFNPEFFYLAQNGALTLTDEAQTLLKDTRERISKEFDPEKTAGPLTGCPALISLPGKPSAIRRLWDWHIEIADQIKDRVYFSDKIGSSGEVQLKPAA